MTDADSATHPDAESKVDAAASVSTRKLSRQPLVTTRVGVLFVVTAICLLVFSLVAHAFPSDATVHSVLWVSAIIVCSLGGLTSMGSVRTLRTIESELCRIAKSQVETDAARPIIGSNAVVDGWNILLRDAKKDPNEKTPDRQPATLDREVVTLARAMRGLPVAWVITSLAGEIRYLNPVASGLLGLDDAEDHEGRDLPERIGLRNPEDETAAKDLSDLLGAVRMVSRRRSFFIGAREIQIRITRSILDGRTGDGEGLAWILNDVTQQELAKRARDQFLMTATHELRTPLTNLNAYAEALQLEENLEIERQKEFCNVIVSEAHRLGRLVDQMLSVSQMEAGSMVAHRHELEVLPIVEIATEQIASQADSKQIELTTDFSPKLPTVLGDRDKLQAAIVNVVGNAIKYTPPQGEVLVRCGLEDSLICIVVQDNGPGIPEDEQPKIFEKFFRGSSAENSDERGNGLGLAFAREVARLHGGDITVASALGEGSTFTIRLPVEGKSRSGV